MTIPTQYVIVFLFLSLFYGCRQKSVKFVNVRAESSADTAQIFSMLNKASSFGLSNPDSLHYYASFALQLSASSSFTHGIAKAKSIEANYLRRKGNYKEAVSEILEAIDLFDSLGMNKEKLNAKDLLAN